MEFPSTHLTEEQSKKLQRGIGLFDFDGTLVPWDSQVVFANYVLRKESWRRFYLPLFAALLPFKPILGDEGMKRIFLSYLWRCKSEKIHAWAKEWAEEWIEKHCYESLRKAIEDHRNAGHLLILSSASPEFYVREVGRILGFDLALGTQVDIETSAGLFPDVKNHKGNEKVIRLEKIIGKVPESGWPRSHGYSDSTADIPMLYACNSATVVNPSEKLQKIALQNRWQILTPPLPWPSGSEKMRDLLCLASGGRSKFSE